MTGSSAIGAMHKPARAREKLLFNPACELRALIVAPHWIYSGPLRAHES